jgi:hypothetical protein
VCDGECCPIGQLRDLCGVCNGTNICRDELTILEHERDQEAKFLEWFIPTIISVIGLSLAGLLLYCCRCTFTTQWWNETNQRILAEDWESGVRKPGYTKEKYDKWKKYETDKLNTYQFADVENIERLKY